MYYFIDGCSKKWDHWHNETTTNIINKQNWYLNKFNIIIIDILLILLAQQDTREESTKEIIEHPQHTIPVRSITQYKSSSSRLPNTLPSIQSTTM